ncbi:MAG: AtpZ/AtpI family protein [Acetatifactor sp.]|nr:AtpZ/AtpI family protein [Acetatifactor sp.]
MSHRRKHNPKYDKSVYRSLVLITQFGINMLVPIGMLSALGIWLDNRYHTSFWTILLFFVGAIAGGQNIYRMAKKIYGEDDREEHGPAHEDHRDTEK